ncbi:MAG: hypothetical protein CVV03_02590 [Firmicutes bacterium HGW-Firmicutes-8]|nr:MAG: hypothetical protein CVV03_02590 [Firmicutes bacterium HGW-Firmicutes-8]
MGKLKWTMVAITVLLLAFFTFQLTNISFAQTGNSIALNAANQLDNLNIEYIKIIRPNSYTEEHWRDKKGLQERSETIDAKGALVNRIIVKENGKRVINIGNENGKIEVYTWILPKNIAKANEENLSKSILDEIKTELKTNKWKYQGNEVLSNGTKVKKLTATVGEYKEVVYVDETTELPIKREVFKNNKDTSELMEERTEEYKKIENTSGKLFEYDISGLKDIPAPVVDDNPGEG